MQKLNRDELILIALDLDLPDLIAFCRSNEKIDRKVCQNDNFWDNYLDKKRYRLDIKGGNEEREENEENEEREERDSSDDEVYDIMENLDKSLQDSQTGIMFDAIRYGSLGLIKYLVKRGFEIPDEALILASEYGYLDIVKYLIEKGVDIHIVDDEALHYIRYEHFDVIKYLIAHGANVHANNDEALRIARELKNYKILRLLNR